MIATLTLLCQGVLGIALFFLVTAHFSIQVARRFALADERERLLGGYFQVTFVQRLAA